MRHKFSFFAATVALLALSGAAHSSAAGLSQRLAVIDRDKLQAAGPLVAPPAACPGQTDLRVPAATQESAMLCMTDYARRQVGLTGLAEAEPLSESSRQKARDILRCDEFDHFACGREFSHWMRKAGYLAASCWRVGENIAWGRHSLGTARSIFIALMRSPAHRENILGDYRQIGLHVHTGTLGDFGRTRVWTQHFGTQQCDHLPG